MKAKDELIKDFKTKLRGLLPQILDAMVDLEGQSSINAIRNDITNSFQQLLSPGQHL